MNIIFLIGLFLNSISPVVLYVYNFFPNNVPTSHLLIEYVIYLGIILIIFDKLPRTKPFFSPREALIAFFDHIYEYLLLFIMFLSFISLLAIRIVGCEDSYESDFPNLHPADVSNNNVSSSIYGPQRPFYFVIIMDNHDLPHYYIPTPYGPYKVYRYDLFPNYMGQHRITPPADISISTLLTIAQHNLESTQNVFETALEAREKQDMREYIKYLKYMGMNGVSLKDVVSTNKDYNLIDIYYNKVISSEDITLFLLNLESKDIAFLKQPENHNRFGEIVGEKLAEKYVKKNYIILRHRDIAKYPEVSILEYFTNRYPNHSETIKIKYNQVFNR